MSTNPYLVKAEATPESNQEIYSILQKAPRDSVLWGHKFTRRRDFHCTLAFVREWQRTPALRDSCATCVVESAAIFGKSGDRSRPLVLRLTEADSFRQRNRELLEEMSGHEDYPEYKPHLTVGYLEGLTEQEEAEAVISATIMFCSLKIRFFEEKGKVFT
jgi:2'-5' RNA ligase